MQIRIRSQLFFLMRIWIRILLLIKVFEICDHWSTDPSGLHIEPPGLHTCKRPRLFIEPLKLLNFNFNAGPDPAFQSNTDPDPASKINADPDPQH
jgi:hypothetical protein